MSNSERDITEIHWTVIVPTYNRPARLRHCLEALTQLEYTAPVEIIIVDDGSNPPAALDPLPENVRLIRQENRGPAAARNRGAAEAAGNWLAFTDDDCAPARDWLLRFAETLEHNPQALVGGTTLNALRGNPYADSSQELLNFFEAWEARDGQPRFFASNNLAVARAPFIDAGGFPEDFPLAAAEDRAFCDAWRASGRPLIRSNARVYHAHDLSLVSFLRQQANYGRGAHRLYRQRATNGSAETNALQNKRSMWSGLIQYPFRHHPLPKSIPMSMLFVASQAAAALGYLSAIRDKREPA